MKVKSPTQKNKNNAPAQKGRRIALWIAVIVLALVLAALLLLWWGLYNTQEQPEEIPTVSTQLLSGGMKDISVSLGDGIEIINIGAYTGAYVEDGSNDVVSGVMMLIVKNTGADAIEYAQITVPTAAGNAEFSASTLLPGMTMVLLEQNRMAYTGEELHEQATADTVAVFKQPVSLCEDQLELQALNGIINVTNISNEDITGDIVIYYKNCSEDMYYGGITYRVRIQGGMRAGEIKQLAASHFSDTGSKVVFVTVG